VSAQPEDPRRRLLFLLLAAVVALGISIGGSYLVVVIQNPSAKAEAPSFVYGSPTP
jgi:hypothetical protein